MKATILTAAVLTATLLTTSFSADTANAQSYATRGVYASAGPTTYYDHASTYEEGVLRGAGALIQSAGDYNYNSSLANINNEEARRRYINNQETYVRSYFEKRRINQQARDYERGPRVTASDIQRFAKSKAPERLDEYEYNASLGSVNWPSLLQNALFTPERMEIDRLLAIRTLGESGLGAPADRNIRLLASQMQLKLQDNIRSLSPAEYLSSKKFLTSLQYETQLANDTVAAE